MQPQTLDTLTLDLLPTVLEAPELSWQTQCPDLYQPLGQHGVGTGDSLCRH